ncbi:MAG: hypothetical protein WAK60_05875 [Sedimentisphaerales bacterium]
METNMWLPKDERRLLQGYYVTIGKVDKQHEFSSENLMTFIKSSASPHLPPPGSPQYVKKYETWLKEWNRVSIANEALEKRGLITGSPKIFVQGYTYEEAGSNPRLTFSLTISGYDLGRKYNSWFTRTGLWFAEYRHHWIWLIVSYIAGIISMLLVNWLSNNVQGAK